MYPDNIIKIGRVERYILDSLKRDGALHFTLLDPEYDDTEFVRGVVEAADNAGTDAFMVGGSLGVGSMSAEKVVKVIKETTSKPLIIFPGNVDNVTRHADAILFMSLLNSRNTYWISGAQALGAPIVMKLGIEPIPMAYIIVEPGGTVSFIGDAKPIPRKKPDIAAAYALAGQYLGMRLVYLESGSGAEEPVPTKLVQRVRSVVSVPIIVGGGIRKPKQAAKLIRAGADIVVTGTLVEKSKEPKEVLKKVIKAIKSAGKRRTKRKEEKRNE